MELPSIGEHCSENTCHQLDYLPMRCDACSLLFCKDHLHYDEHACTSKYKKDVQVPVCPLCSKPVPTPKGSSPDTTVSAHIDQDCKSDKAKKKVFSNRCSKPKCKKKELVPILCDSCKQNFCLTHRHTLDHACEGPKPAASRAGAAAANRAAASSASSTQAKITNFFTGPFRVDNPPSSSSSASSRASAAASSRASAAVPSRPGATGARAGAGYVYEARQVQGGMSEDEALAAALAASMADTSLGSEGRQQGGGMSQEEEDRMLAQALAESERTGGGQAQAVGGDNSKSCQIS